jgi:hypothetical protein
MTMGVTSGSTGLFHFCFCFFKGNRFVKMGGKKQKTGEQDAPQICFFFSLIR